MAWDETDTDYHLTPRGWITGTRDTMGDVTSVEVPFDRVLTVHRRIYQRSEWSPEDISDSLVWRSEAASDEQIRELWKSYEPPVRGMRCPL